MTQSSIFAPHSGVRPLVSKLLIALTVITVAGIFAGTLLLRYAGLDRFHVTVWNSAYALAMLVHSGIALFMLSRRDAGGDSSEKNRDANEANRENGDYGVSSLGPGNYITLTRGGLNSACLAFAFIPAGPSWHFAPFVLYVLSIVFDFFDGFVARKTAMTSAFGEAVEHEFDSIGVIAASAVAWSWGALSPVYLFAAPVRTYYVAGSYLRERAGKLMYPLTPTISARVIAGLYMGFLCVALIPVFSDTLLSAGAPFFLFALVAGLVRDWLVSTGRLDISGHWYRTMQTRFNAVALGWLPVILRLTAAGLTVIAAIRLGGTLSLVLYAFSILLLAGIAGRIAALGTIATLALYVYPSQLTGPVPVVVFVLSVLILILGTGNFSVAKPEEYPFARRI